MLPPSLDRRLEERKVLIKKPFLKILSRAQAAPEMWHWKRDAMGRLGGLDCWYSLD